MAYVNPDPEIDTEDPQLASLLSLLSKPIQSDYNPFSPQPNLLSEFEFLNISPTGSGGSAEPTGAPTAAEPEAHDPSSQGEYNSSQSQAVPKRPRRNRGALASPRSLIIGTSPDRPR
ncbi:hypothetical protein FRC01_014762, partial [Tulasnella sp. 417]